MVQKARQPPVCRRLGFRPSDRDKALSGARKRGSERAKPPITKTQLTAFSARSGGLDDIHRGPECGVYTQMSGIEQVRVRRGLQGCRGAPGVAFIPS